MKKKRYKKLVRKINKLKKLVESNSQTPIYTWPPVWQPDPGQWEVTYTEPDPHFVIMSN